MSLISIKVDCIAALREIKHLKEPDPSQAAVIAELAGADGIGCHLREDRRYIRDRDLYLLKEMVKTKLNLQIAPVEDLIARALEVKPWMATLMPLAAEDVIIRQGVDWGNNSDLYFETAATLKGSGISVSCFIEPEIDDVKNAARAKFDAVELNTFKYVTADTLENAEMELDKLEQMVNLATKLNMAVNCGNGLNYRNIRPLAELGLIDEFNVGYSVIARAVMVGLERAVREIVDIVHNLSEKAG
ncbi:MAG: pyridoxine 5'-phosphate synthase [candidate division Zixibacteria bacterium]|nr:pyridoxine 5'-phosphate synthase [candidate division Zixibacteria bacterium]